MNAELVEEIRARRRRLAEAMARQQVDAAVVASEGNFHYFTGYSTSSWANRARPICLVIPRDGPAVAILSEGEAFRLEEDGVDVAARPYLEPDVTRSDGGLELEFMSAAAREVTAELARVGARRVGLELGSHFVPGLSPTALDALRSQLEAGATVDVSPALWRLRMRKSGFEVARLRRAAHVLGTAFERFEQRAAPEMSERELHRLFTAEAAAAGADRIPYTTVLAGVEEAPLGGASDRRWDPGQFLLLDAGIVVDGYWADFGRIYAGGSLSPGQRQGYSGVVEALRAGRRAVRPGLTAQALAAVLAPPASEEDEPFGRVGHGVGLDLTEPPSLHGADPTVLAEGMTLCLEPNRHVPGVGYLVGEEEIAVTADGADVLSPPFPPEPKVLG